ncbi:MAG: DNA translocase FtsK [Muribaculaceae bacterium]|nr:DNA translocase FtsK [Muribaculaceae bacterium]
MVSLNYVYPEIDLLQKKNTEEVFIRDVISSEIYRNNDYKLPIVLGVGEDNENIIEDLTKMPHLLIAGDSNQGKSMLLHSIIISLLCKKGPGELQFVLIDTKMIEFNKYNSLRNHFLLRKEGEEGAVITELGDSVAEILESLHKEMDKRFLQLKDTHTNSISEYNDKYKAEKIKTKHDKMPYIVVVVDELADSMMIAGDTVLKHLHPLLWLGRAIGIHVIISTQRPSKDVLSNSMIINMPAHIAFKMKSTKESEFVIGCKDACKLSGSRDLLFSNNGELKRLRNVYIDVSDVEATIKHIASQPCLSSPYYLSL